MINPSLWTFKVMQLLTQQNSDIHYMDCCIQEDDSPSLSNATEDGQNMLLVKIIYQYFTNEFLTSSVSSLSMNKMIGTSMT